MDLTPPPLKPPRGVKNSKETSGLLMTVIRTLSTSDSNEQRDQERMKLERDYKKSNQQLEQLVSVHHDDLTKVMNLFGRLSNLVSHSKDKVHATKENLMACQKLLTCRREELKKLWLESTEYKYTLQLLGEIERLKEMPTQVMNLISQKEYLNATKLLISADDVSETTLKDVPGLQELKTELEQKRQELFAKLVKEAKEQIYIQSTYEIIVLKRQGSARNSVDNNTSLGMSRNEKKLTPRQPKYKSKKLLDVSNNIKSKSSKNETVQYSEDPEFVIGNLTESVVLLKKETDLLEEIKNSVHRELTSLATRTTKELSSSDSPNILLEFFQVIMEQLKRVMDCHTYMLDNFKTKHNVNPVFDLAFIWLKMQQVLQNLVSQYVDIQETKKIEPVVTENSDKVLLEQYDVNSYFTRKKHQRTIKGSLFKFEYASKSDGVSKMFESEAGKDKQLLCKPSSSNLTQLYVPLSRFAEEIERQVHGASDKTSKLSIFLNELIGQMFRGKRYEDIANKLNIHDRSGVMLPTKDMNGSLTASPNPLLTALNTSVIYTHMQ